MKRFSVFSMAAGLAVVVALAGFPAIAQPANPPKPLSQAALSAARELLVMKNVGAMFATVVPSVVERTKNALIEQNLNYQKDLNEVAVIVAKNLSGQENEIGEGMVQIYANEFTEQELKDIVTFYKTPLGQKLLNNEPRAIQMSMGWMQQWTQEFGVKVNDEMKTEMKKRNKPI